MTGRIPAAAVAVLAAAAVTAAAPAAAWPPAAAPASLAADAGAAAWSLSVRSSHHNDALPLALMGQDDRQHLAPRRGRNLAYIDDELRLTREQSGWTWSLLARSDATLVVGEPGLRLVDDLDKGRKPAGDAAWQVDARLRAFAGVGAAVGRSGALAPGWRWQGEVQALRLLRWRQRRLDGTVGYRAASGQYEVDLRSDELDNRLRVPYQDAFAASGQALLLAAGLSWDGDVAWAQLGLRDGGWLHWSGVPQRRETLDTATQATDEDGFLVYRPLLQGQNSQASRVRWWPWRGRVAVGARLPDGSRIGVSLDRLPDYGLLPALQWQWPAPTTGGLALAAEWRLHERRLGLSLDWRGLSLRVGADRLGAAARSRELALGWRLTI